MSKFNIKKDNTEKIKAVAKFYDKHEVEVIILLNKIDLLNTESFYKKVNVKRASSRAINILDFKI